MKDKCVVRNQAYKKSAFQVRERHNERKNQCYCNGDIVAERAHLNVHFKECPTTYEKEFNRMVRDGEISLRGLKPDANVFDELVFDVNTGYFEENGGYEYAKRFFAEAYNMAVKEVGGEQYILSAVLHADERNKALSDKLGRDVYHYHLHVVYVPVVEKEIKWTKRCANPDLVGKVKEVIQQVSHSKKWPRHRNADGSWVNSYSLLQDRFYEHMVGAGFTGFDRGERGSTAQHLSVLDYKIKKDEAKVAFLAETITQKEKRLAGLEKKLAVTHKAAHTFGEIEQMGRKGKTGKIILEPEDWTEIRSLCREGILSRGTIPSLKRQVEDTKRRSDNYRNRLNTVLADTEDYRNAKKYYPERVQSAIDEIMWEYHKQADRGRVASKQHMQPEL